MNGDRISAKYLEVLPEIAIFAVDISMNDMEEEKYDKVYGDYDAELTSILEEKYR